MTVTPVIVNGAAVMEAVVVGWVSIYLPASSPESVKPEVVTVLPEPTFLLEKVPEAPALTRCNHIA